LLSALLALGLTGCGSFDNGVNNPSQSLNDTGAATATNQGSDSLAGPKSANTLDRAKTIRRVEPNYNLNDRVWDNINNQTSTIKDNTNAAVNQGKISTSIHGRTLTGNDLAGGTLANNGLTTINRTKTNTNGTVSNNSGASYGQMLRNGRVNDRDGYLLDGENSVTPGRAHSLYR
jgi:hypothetical protein